MLKKLTAILMSVILLVAVGVPAFAADESIVAIAQKIKDDTPVSKFTDDEIIQLFEYLDTSGLEIDKTKIPKWVRGYKRITSESLSVPFHEEIHVFTYGEENCERLYDRENVWINKAKDTLYKFGNEALTMKPVPIYLKAAYTISNMNKYKVIREYLENEEMLPNTFGLNGLVSEYYAFVKELEFLINYKNFCEEYGIKDTASERISLIVSACDEWAQAGDEYVRFIEKEFDGLVFQELTNTNTLAILEKTNELYEQVKKTVPGELVKPVSGKEQSNEQNQPGHAINDPEETYPDKNVALIILESITDFFKIVFYEFSNWLRDFFSSFSKSPLPTH